MRGFTFIVMLLLLSGCQMNRNPIETHRHGVRLAKLHLEKDLNYQRKELTLRGEDDLENLEWQRFWSQMDASGTPSAKMIQWNNRMHTLYAVYFNPLDPDRQAIWVFVDRNTAQIAGVMPTVRLHDK